MGRLRWSNIVFAIAYVVLVVGVFLALGGVAYAGNPTSAGDQYCTNSSASDQYNCTEVEGVQVSSTSTTSAASAGATALPNTGLSLVGVVLVGGCLVVAGVALRRRERRSR